MAFTNRGSKQRFCVPTICVSSTLAIWIAKQTVGHDERNNFDLVLCNVSDLGQTASLYSAKNETSVAASRPPIFFV